MHCLMGIATHGYKQHPPVQLNPQCLQAVTNAVQVRRLVCVTKYKRVNQVANPMDESAGEVKVDKVLYASCRTLIEGKCSEQGVTSMLTMLSCLMSVSRS